ncbi:MAG: hydrogenase maturation protease [Desulfarculaceae bacterium]
MARRYISYSDLRALKVYAQGPMCIVGYGNRGRRDDGVGPWVVERLNRLLPSCQGVRLLARTQLEPDLLEEMGQAKALILLDASAVPLQGGISWTRIHTEEARAPFLIHSLNPASLLGLMGLMQQRPPATWLVSIQGGEFGLGEGLSRATEQRARRVTADLYKIVAGEERT